MSDTLTRQSLPLAGPGRLLVIALAPIPAFMALAHFTVIGDTAASMTPEQLGDRAIAWVGVSCLWVMPVVLAGIAFLRLATILRSGRIRPLAAAGIVLLVSNAVVQSSVAWLADTSTVGDSALYGFAVMLSLLGWWAVDVAAVLTCRQLRRAGIAPRAALVVGLLTAVLTAIELAVYLPALIGSEKLQETVGLPPMLLPLLWAILGGILWKRSASGAS